MKITKKYIEKIIREEMAQLLKEVESFSRPLDEAGPLAIDSLKTAAQLGRAGYNKLRKDLTRGRDSTDPSKTPSRATNVQAMKAQVAANKKKIAAMDLDPTGAEADKRFWESPPKLSDIGKIKLYLKSVMDDVRRAGLSNK